MDHVGQMMSNVRHLDPQMFVPWITSSQGDHRSLNLYEYGQAEKTIDALQQARMVTGIFR
jgi:hypothetical protein